MPGTERNTWLSEWCQANSFVYDPDQSVTVTVCFDYGVDEAPASAGNTQEVEIYSLLNEPETPIRVGWRFLGWFRDGSRTPWDFTKDRIGAIDLTLKAHWEKENADEESANGLYRVEEGAATLLSYALAEDESTVVTIPSQWQGVPVTAIADGAFAGERLTVLTIPSSVISLSAEAFMGAEKLCRIAVQQGNTSFSSRDGILYNADGTQLIFCPSGRYLSSFTVPEGVTEIGPNAFAGHEELQSVTFSSDLHKIGDNAFQNCGLTELALPDGLQMIGKGAFRNCYSLKTVEGAAGCSRIGDNAFASTGICIFYGAEDSALVRYALANNRPYNIFAVTFMLDDVSVEQYRVKAGESLTQPKIQAPEERIPEGIWYTDAERTVLWNFDTDRMPMSDLTLYARSLPIFETEEYESETVEGEEAPASGLRVTGYNGAETEITVPQRIGELPIYTVDATAFSEGSAVTLPGDLREIDPAAFEQRSIMLYVPAGSAAEQLLLEKGYTLNAARHKLHFESNGGTLVDMFAACTGDEVILPAAVRDGGTLLGWYSDKALTVAVGAAGDSYVMPDEDLTLYAAWEGAAPVYSFLWEQRGESIAVTGTKNVAEVEIPATINGLPVTAIDEYAFSGDTALSSLILPDGLTEIGSFAFFGCGLAAAELPETLTSVESYAFGACPNLSNVSWPASVPKLSAGVFSGDSALTELTLPEGVTVIGDYALEGCTGLKALTIPDSVNNIGSGALKNMSGLETLTLGTNTAGLGAGALDACSSLKQILVASGNTHYESVDGVLYYTDRAGLVRYPAGSDRGSYTLEPTAMLVEPDAFDGAKPLENVVLPDGLVQLGSGAFRGCEALGELEIPDSVAAIGTGAFPRGISLVVGEDSEALRFAQAEGLAYRVRGQEIIPAVSVAVEKDSLTLMEGRIYTLSATVEPANTTDDLQWFSANPEILRVDNGVFRPLRSGETEIVVMAGAAECTIPVTITDWAFRIDQPTVVLYEGDSLQMTVSFADNVSVSEVSWYSDIAGIGADGLLTSTGTGISTVTASLPDGTSAEAVEVCLMNEGTLALPEMLQTVDEEAFRGSASIQAIVLPESVTAIGDWAFADCAVLRVVLVPDSVTEISDTAFDGSPNAALVALDGEKLEAYTKVAGITYVSRD